MSIHCDQHDCRTLFACCIQSGLDGRIDYPDAGWKGRSLWANYGTHLIWHVEDGKETTGKMVQFQIRPDPLSH